MALQQVLMEHSLGGWSKQLERQMTVGLDELVPGAVFRFKTAARRVVGRRRETSKGFMVEWAYADGKLRGGRAGGSQWCHYFRKEAIESIPGGGEVGDGVQLLPDRRTVSRLAEPMTISLTTKAPAKWAMVDMETGQVWGHDGEKFVAMSADRCDDVAHIARGTAIALRG